MQNSSTYLPISAWAEDDRPREKLLLKGRTALSDAELIAILLGSGSREESAVDLAKRILQHADFNLYALGQYDLKSLTAFKGMGPAKAVSLIAALELGRRRRSADAINRKKISSSQHSFEILQPLLGDLAHEEFWILILNTANGLLSAKKISQGGLSATVVDGRMVFKEALLLNGSSIILGHNHPSGHLLPSQQDKQLTKNMIEAGKHLGLPVLDHIIVAGNRYYSFVDEGLM